MWIIYALILHILLLGSIFVIYFRSPVLTNLEPQDNMPVEAVAKRLVLFVTDGLRAESFYYNNFTNVPNIRQLIDTKQGIYGISKTQVPTESRPGHIALIAGLYEDPSAVMRGWKENPIEFDTVFNRSRKTYAWGANDILHIFSRLATKDENHFFFDSYNHELDFSGKEKTYELDKWVFNKVEKLLQRKSHELQNEEKVIYFLHLLGLDTAGHVHKPNTELFLENLNFTDKGIKDMYELFENTFTDGKTAYILTSDHGMTNAGSHGAGDTFETETPFFIWGAGINTKPFDLPPDALYEIEQVQMAPLMASLLGIYPPMNNFGILPRNFINCSEEYIFYATQNNAIQLYRQYKALLKQHEKGGFTKLMPKFILSTDYDIDIEEFEDDNYKMAIDTNYKLMNSCLEGIDYYFRYYEGVLLVATTITFLGWFGYLLKLLGDLKEVTDTSHMCFSPTFKLFLLFILGLVITTFCILQKLPWNITLYLLLPLWTWTLFFTHKGHMVLLNYKLGLTKLQVLLLFVCSELLVYTFFDRRAISLGYLLFSLQNKISKDFFKRNLKFYISCALSIVLPVFPLLPTSVGWSNNYLLYCGIFVTLLRPFLIKNRLANLDKFIVLIALFNGLICIGMHSAQMGLLLINQIISWGFLGYIFLCLFTSSSLTVKKKLEKFVFLLTSLYALLSTSYESLFVLLLICELILSIDCSKLYFNYHPLSPNHSFSISSQFLEGFRLAFLILLYTFFSFFGSGNIASISSFDPNIIRCFLTTFYPFVIMFLVILKLIIPIFLIVCVIFALTPLALQYERQIFICFFLICDIMGLNFLFLVKNKGSWLEIGSSISHFVIMQVTTVVLVLFVKLAKIFLQIKISNKIN